MEVVAKGGRKWKKRRKRQFQQSYLLASLTHHSVPKLANIQILAGNYKGEDITYNTSWRKLQEVKAVSKKVARKAFELVILFLEDWNKNNLGSIVEWAVDEHKCIQHIFVCPTYMDKVLSYMCLVNSVDAAHLNLAYKGTIFIYSGLTGNDEAYILAFGISGGNEDYRTWNIFNKLFATACPSLSLVENDMLYPKFVIVLDRDKGLDKFIMGSFPTKSCHRLCSSYQAECQDTFLSKSSRNGISHCYCIFNDSRREISGTVETNFTKCL